MSISEEKQLEILYDHYKDSFTHIREYSQLRNRLFLLVALLLTVLQVSTPDNVPLALSGFLKQSLGIEVTLAAGVVGVLLWVVLLAVVIRYFQISLTVDQQYELLHRQEKELCRLVGWDAFVRERSGYVSTTEYPAFRKLVATLYGWFFPLLLIVLVAIKGFQINRDAPSLDWPVLLQLALVGATVVATGLYIASVHRRRPQPTQPARLPEQPTAPVAANNTTPSPIPANSPASEPKPDDVKVVPAEAAIDVGTASQVEPKPVELKKVAGLN